jgi:hypothetical protein
MAPERAPAGENFVAISAYGVIDLGAWAGAFRRRDFGL